ncbi:hypothetical protein NQZ79_g933 [Umbelopsis isabellina]|nr:hypothetical protein NQZ79_g933 [Umbelopsis isabellina]
MPAARGPSISTAVLLVLGTATVLSTTYYFTNRRYRRPRNSLDRAIQSSEPLVPVSIPRQNIPLARALGTLTPVVLNESAEISPSTYVQQHIAKNESQVDSLLSFFSSATPNIEWSTPSLPSLDNITGKMSQLYAEFPNQINSLRESYNRFWDMLTMDDFRKMIDEIREAEKDPSIHPEITRDASVREGNELSKEEKAFIEARKQRMVKKFAKFIGVSEDEVHIDDLPVVGVASSGGGLRAMIGNAGYLKAMEDSGVLDCTMYTAAVSGSTWTLIQNLSSLSNGSSEKLYTHMCDSVHTHIVNIGNFLGLINSSKYNAKAIMEGIVQRYDQQNGSVNLVDIFGMLLGAILLTNKDPAVVEQRKKKDIEDNKAAETKAAEAKAAKDGDSQKTTVEELSTAKEEHSKETNADDSKIAVMLPAEEQKISQQQKYLKDGAFPMPIYCVVRHAIKEGHTVTDEANDAKAEEKETPKNKEDETTRTKDTTEETDKTEKQEDLSSQSTSDETDMYQWFEFTPYEVGSEELSAWVPTWAFGRTFKGGNSSNNVPEQNLGSLMGAFGSAFTATLAHFYEEVRGLLPTTALQKADSTIEQYEESVTSIHPISPACFPNPFYELPATPPKSSNTNVRSESIIKSPNLYLMDAGMDNNIPFYPLLRTGRSVDVVITFDLSADIQRAPHFERAEGWVKRRGILGWPVGAGWPNKDIESTTELPDGGANNVDQQDDKHVHGSHIVNESEELKEAKEEQKSEVTTQKQKYGLGACTVFASSASETTMDGKGKNESEDNDGTTVYRDDINPITVVYFPLIGNDGYDPDYDPQENEVTITWNFVYNPENVKKLYGLAEYNWNQNVDQVREVLRGVWERKKAIREKRTHPDVTDQFSNP